jgi:hypothetical protein
MLRLHSHLHLRHQLARGYALALDDALHGPSPLSARVPVEREQVLAAAADIERLVALLDDDARALPADAVIEAHALLTDGTGPMFTWAEPGTLRRRVRMLCEAMG